ncbi:protein misato [Drosophila miranda]|uniref:protein misato n=1 Tax=Drosophila miranda TaxID=7229 RepID=UPI0007E69B7B|nr:protein misato [Drosophila miranda]
MDFTREILSFQFGTYANYVGAHFWNQQEANFVYDGSSSQVAEEQLPQNDVLYREGLNDYGQTTYTPRLLSVDLAGNLAHLPIVGELYGNYVQRNEELLPLTTGNYLQKTRQSAEQNNLSTVDQLEVREQPLVPISEYQRDLLKGAIESGKNYKLADTTRSWADYLYARYHPRTLNVLPDLIRDSDVQALATQAAGKEIWDGDAFNEDFCNRIRQYVEECEGLQGFHILFDIDDGFSGLASKCMEHLNDEYSRVSFALPLHYPRIPSYNQADPRTAHSIRVVNSVLSYYHLSEQATMFTPLSTLETIWRNNTLQSRRMPGLEWKTGNLYQTSAVLAAFMDTMTLSYRLRQTPQSLVRFCENVCPVGRKMTAAAMALPLGMQQEQDLIDYMDHSGDHSLLTQLTPGCEAGTSYVVQSVMARGIPTSRLKRPQETAGPQLRMAAYGCNSVSQMLQLYYQCSFHGSVTNAASTPLPFKTQLPFPYEIFQPNIASDGFKVAGGGERESSTRVESTPVLAALQNSTKLGDHLDNLHTQTHRVQIGRLQSYSQSAVDREEYETALDKLLEFRDNYADQQYL